MPQFLSGELAWGTERDPARKIRRLFPLLVRNPGNWRRPGRRIFPPTVRSARCGRPGPLVARESTR